MILLALASACASTATAPESEPSGTATPELFTKDPTACRALDVPDAILELGIQRRDGAGVAIGWDDGACNVNSHPADTLPLIRNALLVPAGASPQLTFTRTPDAATGFAWQPDFAAARDDDLHYTYVRMDDRRNVTRVDLAIEAAASQALNLTNLPVGAYAVEVQATWPQGTLGYAFHVEIVER